MPFVYNDHEFGLQKDGNFQPLSEIIEGKGESVYVYDLDEMLHRIDLLKDAFSNNVEVHYAMKANSNNQILTAFSKKSIGVDVVSGGEIELALAAGFKPDDIVFSGVGKSKSEIQKAIDLQIKQINVECPQELQRIGELAKKSNKVIQVAFRMNPDVDPETHPYIKTGFRENKFGMDESFMPTLEEIMKLYSDNVQLVGLTLHIGSQIKELSHFIEAVKKVKPIWDHLRHQGYDLQTLDIGGGLGLSYENDDFQQDYVLIKKYGEQLKQVSESFGARLLIEPGRIITARAGVLVTDVQYIKKSPYKNFAIVSAGMHQLMRPCLYNAFHRITPLMWSEDSRRVLYDIVGPICESSDVLGHDRNLPEIKQGDKLAICEAGAYGFAMANTYNAHGLPEEIVL